MQMGAVLIGICIGVIATAIFEFICSGMSRVVEQISISPLRKFWKPFLKDEGIIVIPPYPKNHPDFSVNSGTGYNDCIASGEIRKFLALLSKEVEVKEEISDHRLNLIVIGGPISNPAFKEVINECKIVRQVESSIVFRDHNIVDIVDGEEYPCNEDSYGYGLLYLCKDLWKKNQTIILVAGCHGPDTRKLGELLTTKRYIKQINRDWNKRNYFPAAFMLKYLIKGDTSPKDIVVICRKFTKSSEINNHEGNKIDKKE